MARSRCPQCGELHSEGDCPPRNDNAPGGPAGPYDEKAWRKAYMRKYMADRRARQRAEKAAQQQPKDMAS
jgi:hypothetical protein